jgi:recombination protein RecR
MFSPLLDTLIRALRVLPGVGQKTAQRMALHLLERDRTGAANLITALQAALDKVGHCESCRIFSETPVCVLCGSAQRDHSLLCVVESPADLLAIEQSGMYHGLYFVLRGHLSPLDGLGPEQIGIPLLRGRLSSGQVQELILATGTTVEGEATAYFIQDMAKSSGVKVTRIAHGVPMGGDLEYVDANTISLALSGRRTL